MTRHAPTAGSRAIPVSDIVEIHLVLADDRYVERREPLEGEWVSKDGLQTQPPRLLLPSRVFAFQLFDALKYKNRICLKPVLI